jgi:hypothetical protein
MRFAARTVEVGCVVDVEQSREWLHAHVELDGVEVRPGDCVLVHGAPTRVGFGEHRVRSCRATIHRAGPAARIWARFGAWFALTDLFEVGFSPRRQG